jgi:hypothetical protein
VYKYSFYKHLRTLAILAGGLAVAAASAEDLEFHAYPNPFTAGYEEANIFYRLPAKGTVSIFVYDVEGDHVLTVADRIERIRGRHNGQDVWDGRDERGEFVPSGPYLLIIEVLIEDERFRETFILVAER